MAGQTAEQERRDTGDASRNRSRHSFPYEIGREVYGEREEDATERKPASDWESERSRRKMMRIGTALDAGRTERWPSTIPTP